MLNSLKVLLPLAGLFAALFWLIALYLVIRGTLKARTFFRRTDELSEVRREPVSLLKPIKGFEPALEENLATFFRLQYETEFEILFSLASSSDPARPVIEKLIAAFPDVEARLVIGDLNVGPNPKVNNLMRAYQEARYDWILISDSNVRVPQDYLSSTTAHFGSDVGVVTAVVAGVDARRLGGCLESVFLNTFYSRWMFLADHFDQSVVVGKSMLFRRSVAKRFGDLQQLGRFLAEDYMAGQAMKMLGLKVSMMKRPIEQPLPNYTLKDFWSRHLRWGRSRRAQAPLPVFFEPWINMISSGLMGAFAVHHFTGLPSAFVFVAHGFLWLACDLLMIRRLGQPVSPRTVAAWFLRECLALPLWIHMMSGNTVIWRGHHLRVKPGGLLESLN